MLHGVSSWTLSGGGYEEERPRHLLVRAATGGAFARDEVRAQTAVGFSWGSAPSETSEAPKSRGL